MRSPYNHTNSVATKEPGNKVNEWGRPMFSSGHPTAGDDDDESNLSRVEGLILHGAIKPDERPLWFDVYKAFPPIVEPKYAQPKPEIKTIQPILYQEDVIRAKFHSKGHGTGAINMLTATGETHMKRLIQQYNTLKAEGQEMQEDEIIDKCAELVNVGRSDRQADVSKLVNKTPKSATAQVLTEVDIKNIFKEEK